MILKLLLLGYGHYYLTYKKQFQKATDFNETSFENHVYRSAILVPILVFSFPVMALLLHMSLIAFPVSFPILLSVLFAVPVGIYLFTKRQYYLDGQRKIEVIQQYKEAGNKKMMSVYTVILVAAAISIFAGSIYMSKLDWYPRAYSG